MAITCCSGNNFPTLSHIGIAVHPLNNLSLLSSSTASPSNLPTFHSKEISRQLIHQSFDSILTVNERLLVTLHSVDLVCVVNGIKPHQTDDEATFNMLVDEHHQGRVTIHSQFHISSSHGVSDLLTIVDQSYLPEGDFPEDIIHITTSDMEWFPVNKYLLTPCLKLTRYVQSGRGKYKDNPSPLLPLDQCSPDAPQDDRAPHVKINVDCCTFDRILLFLTSLHYPKHPSYNFKLELSEINNLLNASQILGLTALNDLCHSKLSTFSSRVRRTSHFRLSEIQRRNSDNEMLLILDGMVLDITRWIDEHPGGAGIIPTQALNMDCTVFFEIYHVSKQALLYIKEFYVGELAPEDEEVLRVEACSVASDGFLRNLREFTSEWRVELEAMDKVVHKSL